MFCSFLIGQPRVYSPDAMLEILLLFYWYDWIRFNGMRKINESRSKERGITFEYAFDCDVHGTRFSINNI